jgi:hypothetical protein
MENKPPTDDVIERSLDHAVGARLRGGGRHVAAVIQSLADPPALSSADAQQHRAWFRRLDRLASRWVDAHIRLAWERGWQPRDLVEYVRRNASESSELFITDAIGSESQRYALAAVDDRWAAQLEELGAQAWWSNEQTVVGAWAAQRGEDRSDVLHAAIDLVVTLRRLPTLEQALPLPGEAKAGRSRGVSSDVDEKVLGRIRALLAKAESTDFPDEAEALSAKAQQLMTKFSLDRALLTATDDQSRETVAGRRIWLDKPYVKAKSTLVSAAARANRCRTVFDQQIGFVSVIGDETDLRLVDVLATSLLVQASRAMLANGSQRGAWGRNATRSYRQSFLVAYGNRIGERLTEAVNAGRAEVGDEDRLLPVLAAKDAEIDAEFAKLFPNTTRMKINVSNAAGWRDGRVAADMANLDVHRSVGRTR